MVVDTAVLVHDIRYFLVAYALAIATAFLPPELAWHQVRRRGPADRDLHLVREGPLRRGSGGGARRRSRRCGSTAWTGAAHQEDPEVPRLRIVNVQVVVRPRLHRRRRVAVRGRGRAARDTRSASASSLLALVIAPIATELPEKFNSLIWVRQGKDTLAMGNITGAMVLPVGDPDLRRPDLRGLRVAHQRELAAGLPVGRDHVPRGGRDLRADVAPRDASTARACSSAGCCTSATSCSSASGSRGSSRPADAGPIVRVGVPGAAC